MAELVAEQRGFDKANILSVPSASVPRGCASPPDISMDSSRLTQDFGFRPRSFREALQHMCVIKTSTVCSCGGLDRHVC